MPDPQTTFGETVYRFCVLILACAIFSYGACLLVDQIDARAIASCVAVSQGGAHVD